MKFFLQRGQRLYRGLIYFSLAFLVLLLFITLGAPWLAPFPADAQNLAFAYAAPSQTFWFGTDALGRDLFSRLILGSRVSVGIALFTTLTSACLGIVYGIAAAAGGGWIDRILMRIVDIFYTLPALLIMILVMLVFGRDFTGMAIALTLTGWLGTARLMRAQVWSWKSRSFVEAGRALGLSPARLIVRHILPNTLAPLIVELSYQIPTQILAEAFLSFLGIGLRPPTPSWGILAEEGWRTLRVYPHLTIFPGLLIFCTMLSFNVLGDALRDKLDPFTRNP